MNDVWIISGNPAAGKTTTSKALAKRFAKAAVISRDDLQAQIISGNVWPDELPEEEAMFQIDMNIRNQCALAKSYLEHGFTPVCDDVVGKEQLSIYKESLEGFNLFLVTINSPFETVLKRDKQRSKVSRFSNPSRYELLKEYVLTLSGIGLWVDNSMMSVEETVSHILATRDKCLLEAD